MLWVKNVFKLISAINRTDSWAIWTRICEDIDLFRIVTRTPPLKKNYHMLKIVGFQNDIAQFPGVLATSEMVQNASSSFKESIKRTFRYEFLLGTHPRSTSRARTKSLKWPKNGKSRIFEMSSSVVVLISRMKYGQKWKVWVFQMCFAPLPNVLRPLHLILARCHF